MIIMKKYLIITAQEKLEESLTIQNDYDKLIIDF